MPEPKPDAADAPDYYAALALAERMGEMFSGRDLGVVTAALAEALSRALAQQPEEDDDAVLQIFVEAVRGLAKENRAIYRHRTAAEAAEAKPGATVELTNHPGYVGAFTTNQVPGAIKNGTRIVKQNSERSDTHADGSTGRVLGSLAHPGSGDLAYFVEWDDEPRVAVGVIGAKIAERRRRGQRAKA